MRTVIFFRKEDKIWVSPGSLWAAIQSGELLGVIKPPHVEKETLLACFYDAAALLKQKWAIQAKNGIIPAIWCLFSAFSLFWPPLAVRMPEIVRKVLLVGLGIGIGSEIASAIMVLRKKRLLADGKARLVEALEKRAISRDFAPPAAFYRSGANFRVFSAKTAVLALLGIILLNSVVLAFPGYPVVVSDSYIVKRPVFVLPGTQWEWRKEYHAGSVIGILAVSEDEETVWAIKATYQIWHLNMLQDPGPWRGWLSSRLNWLVGKISENAWQDFPPGMGQDERAAEMVAVFHEPELQEALEGVLIDHFNEHHRDIMRLSVVRMEVVEMSIGDYISTYNKQKE